jgi:hypothetical protein
MKEPGSLPERKHSASSRYMKKKKKLISSQNLLPSTSAGAMLEHMGKDYIK